MDAGGRVTQEQLPKEQRDCGNLMMDSTFLEIASPDKTGLAKTGERGAFKTYNPG